MKNLSTAMLLLTLAACHGRNGPWEATGMAMEDVRPASACKGLCLKVDRMPGDVGDPISGTISWRNAPAGSYLNVYLTPIRSRVGLTKPGRNEYYGQLLRTAHPLGVTEGTVRFRWKGSGFWCAPTDYDKICDEYPPADTYRLSADVISSNVSPMAVLQRSASPDPIEGPRTFATVSIGPIPLE